MERTPACILLFFALAFSTVAHAELMASKSRTPQFPLKTQRTLVSDDAIATARHNLETYDAARAIADKTISRADEWAQWDDAALRKLVPTADVPRAFNVGTAGCPKCGQQIYEKGGTYPWIIDPRQPYTVKCPVDESVYPSNDYAAHYDSGLSDTSLLTGDCPDNGWGWVGPNGERYWFVAYANHWTWRNHIIPAVHYLAQAYILTGRSAYAHKAAVLLDRIAEVYPNMDYHGQSRYGQLQEANGSRYEGKIVNLIWETGVLTMLAEGYDFVWETIDGDTALQALTGKTGEEIRANIEANLLEEGIDAYFAGKVRGNFGMHQKALVYAGLVRQYGDQEEWFDGLLNNAGASDRVTGLNYALYNLVYRDGVPYETSPGYNFSWVVNLSTVAEALERAGYNVYAIPKMHRLYDAVLDLVNVGLYTPSVGDSGSVYGGKVGQNAFVYQSAFRAYGDPRYHAQLQSFDAVGGNGFTQFDSLLYPPIEPADDRFPTPSSRLLDGYGMAMLNNPKDTVSLALYYGYKGGHGHFDRLHFELFANGQVMMPDTGYPDFMNAYVPGIYTWSKNTITHNTVTVDASRQTNNHQGTVNLFVDQGLARALDIDASGTYGQTGQYRRRLIMVDCDETHSYVVDCFTVDGGNEHDYSLHGPPGTFTTISGEWSEPAPGTLAGKDVPLGYIYDDPKLAPEDYTGSYAGYAGSGFQHLFNVQRLLDGSVIGEWSHERDAAAKLRIYLPNASSEVRLADAQVSPVKHKEILKYLIGRRAGKDLQSRFVSVIEPFEGTGLIQNVRTATPAIGDGAVLDVTWGSQEGERRRDLVFINTGNGELGLDDPAIRTDAAFAFIRYADDTLAYRWAAGGTYLTVAGETLQQELSFQGTVTHVNPTTGEIRIHVSQGGDGVEALPGRIAHFENSFRRTAHPIQRAESRGDELVITVCDDLRVGHVRLSQVQPQQLMTKTGLSFAPVYDGTYVTDPDFSTFAPLIHVHDGVLSLPKPLNNTSVFIPGSDAWIVNVGPGDHMTVTAVLDIVLGEVDR